jgi:hypothetical protein
MSPILLDYEFPRAETVSLICVCDLFDALSLASNTDGLLVVYTLAGVPYTSENLVGTTDPICICMGLIHNSMNISGGLRKKAETQVCFTCYFLRK